MSSPKSVTHHFQRFHCLVERLLALAGEQLHTSSFVLTIVWIPYSVHQITELCASPIYQMI